MTAINIETATRIIAANSQQIRKLENQVNDIQETLWDARSYIVLLQVKLSDAPDATRKAYEAYTERLDNYVTKYQLPERKVGMVRL